MPPYLAVLGFHHFRLTLRKCAFECSPTYPIPFVCQIFMAQRSRSVSPFSDLLAFSLLGVFYAESIQTLGVCKWPKFSPVWVEELGEEVFHYIPQHGSTSHSLTASNRWGSLLAVVLDGLRLSQGFLVFCSVPASGNHNNCVGSRSSLCLLHGVSSMPSFILGHFSIFFSVKKCHFFLFG